MEVFSGVLFESAFAGHVTNPYNPSKLVDVGHFLVAIGPDLFLSLEHIKERMDYLFKRVKNSDRMVGVDEIFFPGELERIMKEQRLRTGIPLVQAEVEALNKEAYQVGGATPTMSPPPEKSRL